MLPGPFPFLRGVVGLPFLRGLIVLGGLAVLAALIAQTVAAMAFGQLLHPQVIDDQQVRLEILGEHPLLAAEGFIVEEVSQHVEDRALEDHEALLDRLALHTPKRLAGTATALLLLGNGRRGHGRKLRHPVRRKNPRRGVQHGHG